MRGEKGGVGSPSGFGYTGCGRETDCQRTIFGGGAHECLGLFQKCDQDVVGVDFRTVVDNQLVVLRRVGVEQLYGGEVDHYFTLTTGGGFESDRSR